MGKVDAANGIRREGRWLVLDPLVRIGLRVWVTPSLRNQQSLLNAMRVDRKFSVVNTIGQVVSGSGCRVPIFLG